MINKKQTSAHLQKLAADLRRLTKLANAGASAFNLNAELGPNQEYYSYGDSPATSMTDERLREVDPAHFEWGSRRLPTSSLSGEEYAAYQNTLLQRRRERNDDKKWTLVAS